MTAAVNDHNWHRSWPQPMWRKFDARKSSASALLDVPRDMFLAVQGRRIHCRITVITKINHNQHQPVGYAGNQCQHPGCDFYRQEFTGLFAETSRRSKIIVISCSSHSNELP